MGEAMTEERRKRIRDVSRGLPCIPSERNTMLVEILADNKRLRAALTRVSKGLRPWQSMEVAHNALKVTT